jgi:hypothetical protein
LRAGVLACHPAAAGGGGGVPPGGVARIPINGRSH